MKLLILLSLFTMSISASELKVNIKEVQDLRHSSKGLTAVDLVRDPALAITDNVLVIDLKKPTRIEEIILENGDVISVYEAKVVGGDGDSGGN